MHWSKVSKGLENLPNFTRFQYSDSKPHNMDMSEAQLARVAVGTLILVYVGYCLLNQKVWVRGTVGLRSTVFAWGTREENQFVFRLHVVVGTALGLWIALGQFFM